jgi:hypothetical protein
MVLAIGLSTEPANADFTFGEPTNLGPMINSSSGEGSPSISANGLSLYYVSLRPGGSGQGDIWVSTRESTDADWGEPVNLGQIVNSSAWDGELSISTDGLELYFGSRRTGGSGTSDIWITTRATVSDPWGEPVNLGSTVNSSAGDYDVCISADGLALYIESDRSGGHGGGDLWVAKRATTSEPWGEPVNLGSTINTSAYDGAPSISADGRMLFFSDFPTPRPGGNGGSDMWLTTRTKVSDPWGEPVNLGSTVNSSANDQGPNISADGSTLYFFSTRSGGSGDFDLWQVPIEPVVDMNGDGIVDAADMCIVVDNWGTDNQLCDIGPMPWGDGVVDVEDLIVLAEHLFEGAGLVAHWALDETTGDVAYDSAGNIDATIYNGQWAEGKINGALDFNGLTTYMDCGDSLRLSTRQMTLAMWLEPQHMGGMRYVFSRARQGTSDFDYVLMRHYEGQVEFAVAQEGSDPVSVMSNATMPLNEWTHIAVCLDGSEVTIYINGQLDASAGYAQRSSCEDCQLWISSLGGDTRYYNGKIDDIRIYNVALTSEQIAALAQ